jgi:hypothetical protein
MSPRSTLLPAGPHVVIFLWISYREILPIVRP